MSNPTLVSLCTLGGVLVCWLIFAAVFIFRKRPDRETETKRDRVSLLGIILQMCGYAAVWLQAPVAAFLPPVAALSGLAGIVFSVFVLALAAGSVWLIASAARTLGKQWALVARVVEGHNLITTGPYAYVRNPIYTGMFGMLIATGLAMEHWIGLIVGVVLFAAGLVVRVRSEEQLLRAAFGQEFEDYAKRVPAALPGIF